MSTSLIAALEQIKRMAENGEYGIADVAGKALAAAQGSAPVGGGPAFPTPASEEPGTIHGATLRDYFAAKAMQAVLAHHGIYEEDSDSPDCVEQRKRADALTFVQVAEYAYGQADAMLAERAQ